MTAASRDTHAGGRMTDVEAVMWSAERDPMLSAAIGSVLVLDAAPDFDRFIGSMERASKQVLRLRERVEEGLGVAPPRWVVDRTFDIANHVEHATLDGPGTERELLDLASDLFAEPFAEGRPLWKFVVVKGAGGRRKNTIKGGLIMKLHHSVSDGIGALRLAEMYLDLERDPASISDAVADPPAAPKVSKIKATLGDVDHVVRSRAELARRVAAEVALWGADPGRARGKIKAAADLSGSMLNQMVGSDIGSAGSEIWSARSAGRHLCTFTVPLSTMKAAAQACEGTINDVFVAGSVIAANRYHGARGVEPTRFNVSFVMSTRSDDKAGGNAFAPVAFTVPITTGDEVEQCKLVRHAIATKRGDAGQASASLAFAATIGTGLPSSLLSRTGRARAARLDWATSNLRGAPFAMYTAGAEIIHMYPIGPTAGTAFNLTAMSYNGTMHFGLLSDTAAVDAPDELGELLAQAYRTLGDQEAQGG